MIETVQKRRRWPWIVLAVCLLLAAGQTAWHLRPLTATEHALLGRWRSETYGVEYDLSAPHRFRASYTSLSPGGPPIEGAWSADEGTIQFREIPAGEPLRGRIRRWWAVARSGPKANKIKFDGADAFWMDGIQYVRVAD